MKKFFLLLLLVSSAVFVHAQNNSFLLYSFKGTVSVVENKAETPAKVGRMLTPASTLKIAKGGMVTLICNEAAMFTITKTGNYTLSQFGDSCRISNSSVSANYVKYVWAQMTKPSGSPGSNRKAFMNTVGAVSRRINNVWIDPLLDTVKYSGGEFPLSWKSYADAKEFDFWLYSAANIGEPLYTTSVDKLKVQITSFLQKMKTGNTYYWTSAVKGEENDELKVLEYVTKETFNAFLTSLKNQGPAAEDPAAQAYRLAFMLEDAHYLSEAHQHYAKAASLAPDNVLYRSTLMSFRKDYEIK